MDGVEVACDNDRVDGKVRWTNSDEIDLVKSLLEMIDDNACRCQGEYADSTSRR